MRVVFLGSPSFALPSLETLIAGEHEVVAVVTQPDRPAGRGHSFTPPPVKEAALRHRLPVLQPENVSSRESLETLAALEPDVLVVAAYGQILRQRLLDLPKRGSLNVHASLLPRWRGASPVTAAILAGDEGTGVTLMEVVRALDAGPMVARAEESITPHDTTGTLEPRLAAAGAALLAGNLSDWAAGRITPQPQDESLVTYAPQLRRTEALIDWTLPALQIWRQIRAYNPWPVAFTTYKGEEIKIWEAWPVEGDSSKDPGAILGAHPLPAEADEPGIAPFVQTGNGRIALRRLQRAGKRPASGAEFLRGLRDLDEAKLGS